MTKKRSTLLDKAADFVDDYIRSMKWSHDTPEYVRILVAGNLRGYAGAIRNKEFLKKERPKLPPRSWGRRVKGCDGPTTEIGGYFAANGTNSITD